MISSSGNRPGLGQRIRAKTAQKNRLRKQKQQEEMSLAKFQLIKSKSINTESLKVDITNKYENKVQTFNQLLQDKINVNSTDNKNIGLKRSSRRPNNVDRFNQRQKKNHQKQKLIKDKSHEQNLQQNNKKTQQRQQIRITQTNFKQFTNQKLYTYIKQVQQKLRRQKMQHQITKNKLKQCTDYNHQLKIHQCVNSSLIKQFKQKIYLKNMLQQQNKLKIREINLLVKYDNLQPNRNLHLYIDDHPNLLLILHLTNNLIIGAFSEAELNKNAGIIHNRIGIIFSITKQKHFRLKNLQKSAIKYNDYYLQFGNNQLKIKIDHSKNKQVVSNLGLSHGYFRSDGHDRQFLLGSNEVVQFDNYEIFQVIFE